MVKDVESGVVVLSEIELLNKNNKKTGDFLFMFSGLLCIPTFICTIIGVDDRNHDKDVVMNVAIFLGVVTILSFCSGLYFYRAVYTWKEIADNCYDFLSCGPCRRDIEESRERARAIEEIRRAREERRRLEGYAQPQHPSCAQQFSSFMTRESSKPIRNGIVIITLLLVIIIIGALFIDPVSRNAILSLISV